MEGDVGFDPFVHVRISAKRAAGRRFQLEELDLARAGFALSYPIGGEPRSQPIEGRANLIEIADPFSADGRDDQTPPAFLDRQSLALEKL